MPKFDIELFRRRLTEVIVSCGPRASAADPTNSLRSEILKPSFFFDTPSDEEQTKRYPNFWDVPKELRSEFALRQQLEREAVVESLCVKRADELRRRNCYPTAIFLSPIKGRLLIYEPDANLSDGAAESVSAGFFDVHNIPPWDTWICYFLTGTPETWGNLLCWVPPDFVERAQAGIDVNPECCIQWAVDCKHDIIDQLRAAKLIF